MSIWRPQLLRMSTSRTSENSVKKLSEKSRRCVKRGLPGHRSGTVRPVSAPLYRPNPRSERHPNPFLDSFLTEFYEVGKGIPLPVRTFVLRRAVVPPLYFYAVCYRLTVIVPFMSGCISQW